MMMLVILILFMVRKVEMVNPIPVADVQIKSFEREKYLTTDFGGNPTLTSIDWVVEIYRLNDSAGFLIKEYRENYFALPNEVPAAGDQLILSEAGTLFSLGGTECVYKSFDAKNPILLMVEGFSGCINQNLTFSDPCDGSLWYIESSSNCAVLLGQDCNACFKTSKDTCRECSSGLASNGTTCAECPPGYEADTCGWECVEITTTEAPTTSAPEESTENVSLPDNTTSSAACGNFTFFKPVGVFLILASFLLA